MRYRVGRHNPHTLYVRDKGVVMREPGERPIGFISDEAMAMLAAEAMTAAACPACPLACVSCSRNRATCECYEHQDRIDEDGQPVEGSTPEDQLIDEVIADAGPREPLDDCPKPDPHGPHIVILDQQAGVVQRCPGLRPPPEEVVHLQCSQQLEQAEKTAALHGYELGVEEGRRQAAQAIREETATFCMDGIGRHLVEVCTKLAAGPTHD